MRHTYPQLSDGAWLRQRYEVEGCSIADIAKEVGCSPPWVSDALRRHGIQARVQADTMRAAHERRRGENYPLLNDAARLREEYEAKRRTIADIASELGCATGTVVHALKRLGIQARTPGVTRKIRGTEKQSNIPQLRDKEWLTERYYGQNMTMEEIGAELGVSRGAVLLALKRHGIERKPKRAREGVFRSDSIPQLRDKEWLTEQYTVRERKAREIAVELGCSIWAVQAALSHYRVLKMPPKSKQVKDLPVGVVRGWKGYIKIFMPDHPFSNGKGYVLEHRLVVEKIIGRYLTSIEVVHHINERRDDNREANLLIFPTHAAHMRFHENPPAWVPRCECCGRPRPELVPGRPAGVPILWPG